MKKSEFFILTLLVISIGFSCTKMEGSLDSGKTVARCAFSYGSVGGPYTISGPATICGDTTVYQIDELMSIPSYWSVQWWASNPSVVDIISYNEYVKVIKKIADTSVTIHAKVLDGTLCSPDPFTHASPLNINIRSVPDPGPLRFLFSWTDCEGYAMFLHPKPGYSYEWSTDGINFSLGNAQYPVPFKPAFDDGKKIWARISNECGSIIKEKTFYAADYKCTGGEYPED